MTEARKKFKKCYELIKAMSSEVNPIPVKTALSFLGLCREEFRLPLCSMADKNKEKLKSILLDSPIK